jgi:multidrug resistance efflux pump
MAVKLLKLVRRIPLVIIGLTILLFLSVGLLLFLIEVDKTVRVSGTIIPEDTTLVRSGYSGVIARVYVEEKEYVEKGQLLAELDDTYALLRLAQAQTWRKLAEVEKTKALYRFKAEEQAVKSAKLKAENAKKELDLAKKAYQLQIISLNNLRVKELAYSLSLSDYEKSKVQLELARDEIKIGNLEPLPAADENEASLSESGIGEMEPVPPAIDVSGEHIRKSTTNIDMIKEELERMKIYAPISGRVLTSAIEKRQGTFIANGEALLTLGNLEHMVMVGKISEKKSLDIKPGQKVNIFVSAYPYREYKVFEGEVLNVGPVFGILQGAMVINEEQEHLLPSFATIYIDIIDSTVKVADEIQTLQPGFTAEAEIVIRSMSLLDMLKDFVGKTGATFENLSIHF